MTEKQSPHMTSRMKWRLAIVKGTLIVVTVVVITIVVVALWWQHHCRKFPFVLYTYKPRTNRAITSSIMVPVWTYWEGSPDPTVDLCIQSMRHACDKNMHELHVLREADLYWIKPPICDNATTRQVAALKSDMIRLQLLYQHGGVWLDASVMPIQPLNDWINPSGLETFFTAFMNPYNSIKVNEPCIETSVMACSPRHPLIADWIAECTAGLSACAHADTLMYYESHVAKENDKWQFLQKDYHYVYWCLFKVLRRKTNGIHAYPNVTLYNCRTFNFFPLMFWWRKINASDLVQQDADRTIAMLTDPEPPIILKFISGDRNDINTQLRQVHLNPRSLLLSKPS